MGHWLCCRRFRYKCYREKLTQKVGRKQVLSPKNYVFQLLGPENHQPTYYWDIAKRCRNITLNY